MLPASSSFPTLFDISLTRAELLVGPGRAGVDEEPIEVLPLPIGSAHHLGDLLGHDATWSPDGQQITYAKGDELYVCKADGTGSRKLVTAPDLAAWPRWSPDGATLRFTVNDAKTGSNSLWEVRSDGTGLHPLLPGWNSPPAECCGNWAPDGKYFVFRSTRNGKANIWARREKRGLFYRGATEPVQLTTGGMNYSSPVVSRDGKQIFVIGAAPRGEVVRYDSKSRQLVPYFSDVSAEGLDFSRDGQWVTYVAFPEGTLWRSKVDGSERLQLCFPPMQALLPRWSPDGKRIAFSAVVPGQGSRVYIVSAEGGTAQQMTHGTQGDERDVGWSSDGSSLVFGSYPFGDARAAAIDILDLRTHQISRLPRSEGIFSPRWSPDGRYIAAIVAVGQNKLMLYDFMTKNWAVLADGRLGDPNWSRDGRAVYFDGLSGTDAAYYRVRLADRKLEQLFVTGVRRTGFEWTGLAPDDSPLLLRDTGTQEIYALDWEAP